MKKFSCILAWTLILALLGCPAALAEAEGEQRVWRVGYGSAAFVPEDYDPETDTFSSTYYVAGYQNDHPATGMLDPQYVRAAYISDGNTNIVVAAVDCVGLSAASIENIRTRIAPLVDEYDLADVHIAATHTHAGIDTLGLWGPVGVDGKNDAFMEILYDAAAEAIRQACESQKEGRFFFGSAYTGYIQRDSRLPEIYDRSIYRLRFEPLDGSAGLQIVSYDAHPEALRSDNSRVSADYPCYLGRRIKERTGDDFIFFAGAVGGLIMTHRLVDSSGAEYPVEANVVLTGERLADALIDNSVERELAPELSHATQKIQIDLENSAFLAMAFVGVLDTRPVKGGGPYGLALESRVSLLNLGGEEGATVALVPGEIFPELVLGGSYSKAAAPENENPAPLKDLVGGKLIVWGLADDEIGYIVTPNDFLVHGTAPYFERAYEADGRRHYEETNSVGPQAAYVISDAVRDLAQQIGAE